MALLKPASWADKSPEIQILLFIGMIFVFYFFSFVAAVVLAYAIWGINMAAPGAISDLNNPVVLSTLKFVQIIGSFGTFILPPFLFAKLLPAKPSSFLGLNKNTNLRMYATVFLMVILSIPLINILSDWNSRLILPAFLKDLETMMRNAESNAEKITQAFLKANKISGLLLNILMVAILPALGEELVFRGVLQKLFIHATKNAHWGIIISAMLFSAMHFQFYGFLPRALLGVLFGYIYLWSKSIWLPMFAHFINNGGALLLSYLQNNKIIIAEPEKIGINSNSPIWIMPLSLLLTTVCIYYLYRNKSTNSSKNEYEKVSH